MISVVPILSRMYAPADLGVFQASLTASICVAMVATQRVETIIPAVAHTRALKVRAYRGMAFVGCIAAFCAVGALFFSTKWAQYVAFAASMGIALGMQSVDNSLLIRDKKIRLLAIRNGLVGVSTALCQVAGGYLFAHAATLCSAVLVGRVIGVVLTRDRNPMLQSLAGNSAHTIDYTPAESAQNIIAGALGALAPNALMLSILFSLGPGAAGQIAMAQRSSSVPVTLIGQGLSQGVSGPLGECLRGKEGSLVDVLSAQTRRLLPLGIGFGIIGVIVSVTVFDEILGSGWEPAGHALTVLALVGAVQLVASPLVVLFPMLRMQKNLMALEVFKLVGVASTVIIVSNVVQGAIWPIIVGGSVMGVGYVASLWLLWKGASRWDEGRNND